MEARVILIAVTIAIWFGGCNIIKEMITEEVRDPDTGTMVRVEKQYASGEKKFAKGIFLAMVGLTGALWKDI